ncbi:MAG: polysaccharide deacetylase family protein [Parabacteroides sp.]|nr:polysaccharide deacetylase family protein [Parabacteroides sp.]
MRFLLGDEIPGELITAVGYTDDPRLYNKYSIVIYPSGFFDSSVYGKPASIPALPLKEVDKIPLLFGNSEEEMVNDTLVLHADIVASTFFLITRYEEMVKRSVRDEHGRFPGKESLPGRGRFIQRPLVEEYGLYLRNKLRQLDANLPEEKSRFRKIYLTHDVDVPFYCRTWKQVLREVVINKKSLEETVRLKTGNLTNDQYYLFPWLFEENEKIRKRTGKKRCKTICFFKAGGNTKQDKPSFRLTSCDMKSLFSLANTYDVETGLHSSYQAGMTPELIIKEKKHLETATGKKIRLNRHHFLSCREPEHLTFIQKAGIEHDFSLGYADIAGFRLGTCRAVRWINPATRNLTSLVLHPLTIMDCSLSEKKYMNLSYEEALAYCEKLISQTARFRGDLTLLWHNTSLQTGYLKQLYFDLLNRVTLQESSTPSKADE